MRRSDLAALLAAALLIFGAGCDDEAAQAKAEAEKRKADTEKLIQFIEGSAEDTNQFTEVMKTAAKARVLAWGDAPLLERIEAGAAKARAAHQTKLDQVFAKAHEQAQSALEKNDPAESEKACTAALRTLDTLAPPVMARAAAKIDADRAALLDRIEAAKRATEIMAKAKELAAGESNLQARALVKSYDVVPSFRASPFQGQVAALLQTIPEKAPAAGGDEIVIFDGSSDAQFTYFEKQHDWTWKVPKPPEEPVLLGDNTESTSDTSSIWLGDETWGDLILEVQFNVGDVGLNFQVRQKDEQTFDQIQLPEVKKGEWCSVRIELKGKKAIIRLNGTEKVEQDLQYEKGKIGLTLPPMALVKVRSVKLRLLDKDAKKPQQHVEQPKDDDDTKDVTKKKKKKKPGAETPEAPKEPGK